MKINQSGLEISLKLIIIRAQHDENMNSPNSYDQEALSLSLIISIFDCIVN